MKVLTKIISLALCLISVNAQTPFLLANGSIKLNATKPIVPHKKFNYTYPIVDATCNFWVNETIEKSPPWPKGCWKYQYKNPCNFYEISFDGKSIDSCQK